jgi:hypothetical protein
MQQRRPIRANILEDISLFAVQRMQMLRSRLL